LQTNENILANHSGKMPGMSCRTPDTLQWRAGLSHECHPTTVPGAAHRNHRRTARSHFR